ncbi:hypothetical protein AVEN_77924-1 [Araneus ventricosus]|uniref:DNA2/NAM7 helicase helicase domain-containing protein n=1 Tax=Araneus ventricosus TaxID=182803 RepID=A0A4Y2DWM3_ARAVE|nr:hypothetical protein AVEN_77924-1 [Araneus ventricosus]
MNINLADFACLPIKREVKDPNKVNLQKMSDLNDPLPAMDVNKSVHLDQNDASTVSSTSSAKSNTPKKRTRRRYIYSKPKKKKKKKDVCENLVDTMNILNVEQFGKSEDNHSDCSSDTIIVDDLSEEVSKDSANIGNEISNSLKEEAKLQPPELGKLLISDGMLLGDTSGAKRKKGASGKSRARSTKSKGKRSKKMQSKVMNQLESAPVLSIKKEFDEASEPKTEPPVLLPVSKEPMSIFSEKDTTFSRDFQDTTNLFSASIDITVHSSKKRKPQTARRGKRKQISCDRIINQQPENNTLTFDNYPIAYGNNLHIDRSSVNSREILSTSNFFESSATQMSTTKMTTAKKGSPAKRNIPTSVASDISGNDRNVSNFLIPPFSNVLEQNNPSGHPTNLSLTENKQNSKRKRSSPNKRNTTKGNLKSLDSSEVDNNSISCGFSPVKKTKGRSTRKTPTKKSLSSKQKGLDTVERQCSVKSSLVISVKKELSETLYSDNSVLKHGESNTTEEYVNTSKAISGHNVCNALPSTKKGVSKTYVSLSFEEDTSKKDEPDEHLSFLLSLRSKKSKSKNVKDTECLKNPSKIAGDSSKPNLKTSSILSSSPVKSDSKLQPENTDGNLKDKNVSNSESFLQSNVSCGIELNIPNVKKETEYFPNNSVEMHSVNKMDVKSVNKNIGVECSKTIASNSNAVTQSTFQSESSNSHTSDSSSVNIEKNTASDVVKKGSIGLQENESAILHNFLINFEKIEKNDSEMRAMESLNELAKTYLNQFSESPVLNSNIAKLPSDDNNSKTHDVNIPQLGTSFLELGPKSSENLISKSNNDVLNSFAFNTEYVQGKTCELPSVTLPHIQIKREPEEVLPNTISKAKDSTLEAQKLHKQGSERTSSGGTLEEACLTNERDTSHSILNVDKRSNTEQCQLNNQSQNETSFIETRVIPTACIANTASKSQDSLVLNQNETNKLPCNDSLSIQIKKEQDEVIRNAANVDKGPSTISPVSLVELSENNTTRLTENLPTSDCLNTCTIQSLQNNICNAVTSTSQTLLQNSISNYVSTPVASIKREICSNTDDGPITLHENTDSNITNDISSSTSKEQSLLDPEPETISATQITEPLNVPSVMNSNQSCTVSDLVMADVEKSFTSPSTSPSIITKKAVENSSAWKSNSLISDSLSLMSEHSIDLQDDLILISDESSSESSSISSSSDSDNESIHSLGDSEGPPRKKTRVNLSTGEVIIETDNSVSAKQDVSNSSYNSSKNQSDVNMPKSDDQSSFSEFMERIDDHVTRVRALEKEKELNPVVAEPEVADEHDTPSTEIPDFVPEHVNVCNETTVCDNASTSRSVTPNCRVNSSTPVHEILKDSLDSIMISCSPSYASNFNNLEEFDFLINYKKNELKFRKHPYPGDVPFRKRKPETRYYFRYDKEILNLTIQDIGMKLKEAEKIELHAPEDPGDAIRLDVYRLVPEEAECYYQLLTTDPSLALISKYCQESTVSTEDTNSVDDVICLSGSPSIEARASSLSEVPTKISVNENVAKVAVESLENNKSFAPTPTEQDREHGSFLTNDIVFINEISNSSSQNVIKNAQHLRSSSNDTNAVEVLEINSKNQTDSYENVTKEIPVFIPPLSSELELANLSPAIEGSTCTNTFPNNNSIQSNKIISSIEISEGLSRSSNNMLGNEKSNSSSGVQKALSVYLPNEKIFSNMISNNEYASLSMDKSDNFISLTSDVESSVNIVDSHSGNLNDESSKEIPCDSNNPVLLVEQCSSLNSVPKQSFSDFKQPSSDINLPTLQLSHSSSDYPKLLPMPETLENATSESVVDTQIDEQSSGLLSLQVNESCCSEKDENSQAISSVSNLITNPIFSKLDLPTSELRKILENVNILPSPDCSEPPSNVLNFKETYQYDHASYSHVSSQHVVDYGHGISGNDRLLNVSHYDKEYSYYDREPLIKIPIVRDYGHKSVKDLDNGNLNAFNKETVSSTTTEVRHEVSSDTPAFSKSDLAPDSDEDNFDNDSELPVESSYDQVSNESEQKLDEKKEPAAQDQDAPSEKPQYKSRFQRVMERVSSKKSSKAQPNEHLLTDCFPLKSSKDKSCIRKPIALVQPCSQKFTKNPPKGKKFLPLNDKPVSFKGSIKNKETKKSKKNKSVVKSKKKLKSPLKNKSSDDASSLFQPDKIVKKVEAKEKSTSKSNPVKSSESPGSRLYGRVTNRGSFLTQSSINQPPKPKVPVGKKGMNKIKVNKVPTDELHLMVHSPNIDIIPTSKQLPTCSNELFKSDRKIERSTSFLESTIRTTICSKTSFNVNNSFLRPQLKDPRNVLKNLSPDISCPSPNESSNFFITPEPLISSNLSTILPNVQSRKSCLPRNSPLLPNPDVRSEIPQSGRRTLLPTPQIGFNKRVADDEAWFTSSIHAQNHSDSYRSIPVRDFESEASLLTINSPSIIGSPVTFNAEPSILIEQSSPIISSNVHIPNRGTHHRHSRTRQTRCVCLPPKSLKASVGNAIFDTASVLLLILEWNVDWLVQQQKNHDPPPISTCIRKVVNTYEDNDEYYNTYLPLMLLETWQRIYMSWTHLHQATSPYFCEITSYSVETHSIKVQCQAVFKSSDAERGLFPEEGNIIMVKFGTREKGGIKILGYIRDVKVKPFDASTGSVSASYKCLKYTAGESLQMFSLTFSGAYSSDDFDTNQLIRIQILCNIKSTLKQNDALLNLKNSPLHKNILNPLTDGLRMVTVVTRNADPLKMKNNVSECVRDIIKGITSPHPLPLLTIAKSLPSSDRLLVLPPLIEMMKNSYKNKVLLCTRTTKALTDIGFNLCGGPIKFVILGKKSDIHQKLRKYLLEEVASKKLNKELSEDTPINEDAKNDLLVSTKLDILKNCDVVLSLIRNCHNDLVAQAYADGECVAQMCCIIDEANLCTEPEILIPLLYGISKLILIGDPDVPAKVCSKTVANFDYNRSLFHRAYELDLASE